MATYICKETFDLFEYDDNGFCTGKRKTVHLGAMFVRSKTESRVIGPADSVRLEGITADEGAWLEISEATLAEYFEEAKEIP